MDGHGLNRAKKKRAPKRASYRAASPARSVESTFGMIKRNFGDSPRSKTDVAMVLVPFAFHSLLFGPGFVGGLDTSFGLLRPK